MDCARNERLLALHAGGDLPDGRTRALAAHLQTCEGCRRLASDFAAGRELLGLHEPPEFDAAFFDRIRQNVLREIDDAPPPPAFARLTAILFGRRELAFAACVALLLVAAGAIVPYFREGHRLTTDAPQQVADASGEAQRESVAAPLIDSSAIRDDERLPKTRATMAAPTPHRRQFVANFRRAKRDARVAEPAAPGFPEAAATHEAQTDNTASPGEETAARSEVAVFDEPAERKMLRIELQTGDPNVRIIWLTPQEPEKLPR